MRESLVPVGYVGCGAAHFGTEKLGIETSVEASRDDGQLGLLSKSLKRSSGWFGSVDGEYLAWRPRWSSFD